MQGEDQALRRAPSWRKRFRPRDPHGRAPLSAAADTLPTTFRASTMGPVPRPPSPRRITPEGERGRAGRAAPLRAGAVNAAAGGRAPPASCELANRRSVFRGGCRLLVRTAGARRLETPAVHLLLLSPPPAPGPSRLCPRLGVRGPGSGRRRSAARRPPARGFPAPVAGGPALLLHAARAHCRLLLLLSQVWGASSLQARRRYLATRLPGGRSQLTAQMPFSLSLSSLPLSLRTHALRLPGLATAPEGQLPPAWFHRLG